MVDTFTVLLLATGFIAVSSRNNTGLSAITQCTCPGYNATYQCSILGIGSTIWKGTAFSDCPNNRIVLRHSQYSSPAGATGTCNFGAIVGRSVDVRDRDCYISQIDVFVTASIFGSTIICSHNDGSIEVEVGNSTLTATADPLPPPANVLLTNVNPSQLTFSWDPVGSNCLAIKYNILAENCGSCPIKSNTTTVTCTDPQPQPNPGITCTFRVQTEVCEGVIGGSSDPSTAKLRVPDIPEITAIPTYSQSEKTLTSISVRITETVSFFISNEIDGSTTSYTIINTNSTSGGICDSNVIPASECSNGTCNVAFNFDDLPSQSPCPSTEFSVKVFATNILGDSEESEVIAVEPTNNFVDISYDMTTNSIMCMFMNVDDAGEKSCSIVYRICEHEEVTGSVQKNSTSNNMIVLMLGNLQQATYCYVVTAKNRTVAVNVNGRINSRNSPSQANTSAIVGGVLGVTATIIAVILAILAVIGAVVFYYKRSANADNSDPERLIPVSKTRFKVLTVERDCILADFIEQKKLAFQRGQVFYEFTRNEEDINPEKEVILMDKVALIFQSKNLYTGNKACKMIGAPGQRIPNPKLKDYDVFVQSMGHGYRPLKANSRILYDHEGQRSQSSHPKRDLEQVDSKRFIKINVDEGGELIEIVEKQGLPFKPGYTFFEFMNDYEDIDEKKEVILMDKEKGDMFTGPAAHFMIGAPGREIDRPVLDKWRVFVQSLFKGSRYIHGNTLLLYDQEAKSDSQTLDSVKQGRFEIFDVHQGNNLRSFVEKVCHRKYEARRFFFEFVSREEEITDDKEIILMAKDTKEMFTGLKAKEMIGAPAKVVKKPILEQYRVFVQNGGAGTQYLRPGTSVLYEVNYNF